MGRAGIALAGLRRHICHPRSQRKNFTHATKEIEAVGRKCLGVTLRRLFERSVSHMLEQIVEQFGSPHLLANRGSRTKSP